MLPYYWEISLNVFIQNKLKYIQMALFLFYMIPFLVLRLMNIHIFRLFLCDFKKTGFYKMHFRLYESINVMQKSMTFTIWFTHGHVANTARLKKVACLTNYCYISVWACMHCLIFLHTSKIFSHSNKTELIHPFCPGGRWSLYSLGGSIWPTLLNSSLGLIGL